MTPRTKEQSQLALKKKVRMFYDLQRLRMQCAGRINKKPAEGVPEVELHEIDKVILEARAKNLLESEKFALKDVEAHLKDLPIYQILLEKPRFKGLGPTMAGVILAEFTIEREDTVSKMWSFAGLAPVPARRCKGCNTVLDEVTHPGAELPSGYKHKKGVKKCDATETYASAKAMRPTKGEKLPYNSFLKTKLIGVLAPCLLKCNSPWRKFYDEYKHRKESAGWGVSDGHRHNAAMRFMIKQLLIEIHREWRAIEGLPVREPYKEEYLQKHVG